MTVWTRVDPSAGERSRAGSAREVTTLAYPVVLTQLSSTAMFVIDSAMVGRLGATELASTGYGGIWLWTALTLFLGTAQGVQTFVAQAHGAGRPRECGSWVWQSLYALLPATLIGIGLFVMLFPWILARLAPSPEMQRLTYEYASSRALGTPAAVGLMTLAGFFRGLGDTRTPLYAGLAANALNVVLDYGLIFGHGGLPALGVQGAGLATAVANWTGVAVLVVAFQRRAIAERFGTRPVHPDLRAVRRFARTSAPIGGQWFLDMASFALFSTLVARMGDVPMAASQGLLALLSLSFMQAIGISMAAATLVGRYVGAGDPEAARRSHHAAVRLGCVLAAGVATLLALWPETLLRAFTDEPEVLALGKPLVRLGAAFQLFDALGIIANGSLRGAGDTRWPFVVQIGLAWGFFLPLAWALGVGLGGGLTGAWLGGTIYVAVLATALLLRFGRGSWQEIKI